MSKLSIYTELIREADSIKLTQYKQAWHSWLWRIEGLIDWDGLYDKTLAAALQFLVDRARASKAAEDAAITGPDEEFTAYQRIKERAGTLIHFASQLIAAPVPSDEEMSEAIQQALDTSHE